MSAEGHTLGERVAGLETWTAGHEQRCDDRQKAIGREIGELKDSVRSLTKGAWGVVIAMLAWGAMQLYAKLDASRPLPLPQPAQAQSQR